VVGARSARLPHIVHGHVVYDGDLDVLRRRYGTERTTRIYAEGR
jgi:ABC-type uncharacterized transport system ATPase subunit